MITPEVKIPKTTSVGFGGFSIPVQGGSPSIGRKEFPTSRKFEAYDKIAKYVQDIITVSDK